MTDSPPPTSSDAGASAPLPRANPNLDSFDVVNIELACMDCGYNLRGLGAKGACPECGASVERSVRGDHLVDADPRWVRRLSDGMFWLGFAVAMAVIEFLWIILTNSTHQSRLKPLGEAAKVALIAMPAVLAFRGILPLSTPEPNPIATERRVSCRRVMRVSAAIMTFTFVGGLAFSENLSLIWLPALVVTICATGWYSARLVSRLGDTDVARYARIATACLTAVGVYVTVYVIDDFWFDHPGSRRLMRGDVVDVIGAVFGTVAVVCVFWMMFLLGDLGRRLSETAEKAFATRDSRDDGAVSNDPHQDSHDE